MATITQLLINDATSTSSAVTGSISPSSNKLLTTIIASNRSGGQNTPTITGASMTFNLIGSVSSTDNRISIFRSLSASPGSGALTIDFAGQSQNNVFWSIAEFGGVPTTGINGADAVVQFATNTAGSANNLAVTLAAFAKNNNVTYGGIYTNAEVLFTKGANFTEVAQHQHFHTIETEWANNTQTNVNWTLDFSDQLAAIAIEIATINAGGAFLYNFL